MKHKCPSCGIEYELGPNTLPDCPECIRARMKYPDGITPKHTISGAMASPSYASYISGEVDPKAIFDYMAYGPHTVPSGCALFYSTKHNSFNAVSLTPLGQIPGSGIQHGHHFAAHCAVLLDLEGKSAPGPHWDFEEQTSLSNRLASGEWISPPMCVVCGKIVVYNAGDKCLNCQSSGKP